VKVENIQRKFQKVAPFFETEVKNATSKKGEVWRVLVKLVTMLGEGGKYPHKVSKGDLPIKVWIALL
jgi:hypothetical protein